MADVQCPSCNECFHETTDKYHPSKSPNGTMFRLKDKYRDYGWDGFIEDESSIQDSLCCPECGGNYCEYGKVRVLGWIDPAIAEAEKSFEEYEPELPEAKEDDHKGKAQCPHCGEWFAKKGLPAHIRFKHDRR
jgi:hypothetical protein